MMNRKDKVPTPLELSLGEEGKIMQESNLPLGSAIISSRKKRSAAIKAMGGRLKR